MQCRGWAIEWLEGHPEKKVAGVFLWQTTVVRDASNNSQLTMILAQALSPHAANAQWLGTASLRGQIPVGTLSTTETKKLLASGGEAIDVSSCHAYQRGELFVRAVSDGKGSQTAALLGVAPGVLQHGVVSPNDDGHDIVFKAKILPDDERLVLL